MLEGMLLSMVWAKVRGYKVKLLFNSWYIYPIVIFGITYILAVVLAISGDFSLVKYTRVFEAFYICAFLIPILKFRVYKSSILGAVFIIVGSSLNKITMAANNGKMPVFPTFTLLTRYIEPDYFHTVDNIHVLGHEATKLKILTDVIDMGYSVMSIGDILIKAFAFIVIYNTIKTINNYNRREVGGAFNEGISG